MLTIDKVSLRYGQKVLFNEICATIGAKDRFGLVGSNGSGKTTLFKTIMGLIEIDAGRVSKAKYFTVGYLPQDGLEVSGRTLYKEVESAFEDILGLKDKIDQGGEELDSMDPTTEAYGELLDRIGHWEHLLLDLEEHKLQSKIERVLLGLGFNMGDMQRDTGEFSGGWQMRIALAKLLLREPALLLLDEPTNHLDISSQRWVEQYLKQYEGSLIIISHDRAFLDELCNKTLELSMGRAIVYEGNYSFFEKESVERKALKRQQFKNQEKYFKEQEQFIERFRYKSSKAKQVQSRIKALEKIDRVEIEEEESGIQFHFPPAPRSGHKVLELIKMSKSYGDLEVFRNFTFTIEKGDRIAVVGVNGAGKSTLAKVLAGVEDCTSGERTVGHNVEMCYFAQQQAESMDPTKTALEIVEEAAVRNEDARRARTILGSFLFRGDEVFKKVKVLSGGEKCRLALACMLVQRANCLILDEPTNHLDMRSQEMLAEALKAYGGSLFIVSHNRAFLDPLVTKVLEISKTGVRVFLGNVSYYLDRVEAEEWHLPESEQTSKTSEKPVLRNSKERRKEEAQRREALKPMKKRMAELEELLQNLDKEKRVMDEAMSDPEFFKKGAETKESMEKYHTLEKKLERTMEEWMELDEKLKNL